MDKGFEVKQDYTDEEINTLADWMQGLTLPELFFLQFLKKQHDDFLKFHVEALESRYIH